VDCSLAAPIPAATATAAEASKLAWNLTAEDGRMVHSVWGANYERLVTVKRRYDPGNIFRLNHNIDPSG
jgi:FAD/FMN-containing dehydrogenase